MNIYLKHLTQHFENQFGLDIEYFFRNSILGIIQQVIGVICGLSIIYIFGHYSSKLLFGQYNLLLSYIGIFGLFTLPGIDSAVIRSVAQGREGTFIQALLAKVRYSIYTLPLIFLLTIYYLYIQHDRVFALSLCLIAIFFPIFTSFPLYNEFLTAKKKFGFLTLLLSSSSLLTAVLLGWSIYYTHNILIIITMYLLSTIIPSIIGFWYAFKIKKNNKRESTILAYGKFLSLMTFIVWAAGYVGQILLASLLGLETLAIYSAANRFPVTIQKNLFVFYKPITSKLANQSAKDHTNTIRKHAWKLLAMGFILSVFFYITSPYLITFFFTSTYNESIRYAQALSFSILPLPLSWVLSDILLYQKKKRAQFELTTYPQVIKIILYIIFIPLWGINGLVWTFILERYLTLGFAYYLYKNR